MKKLYLLIIFIAVSTLLFSQQSINACGGVASGIGGNSSYSVGQVFYQTNIGSNVSVLEGVQQPYEISVLTKIEENIQEISINVYPNPFTDLLQIDVNSFVLGQGEMCYRIIDLNGGLISNDKITDVKTEVQLKDLSPSTYFLTISKNSKDIITYKIIKY